MPRSRVTRAPRTAEEIVDVIDLRAVIREALTAIPIDDTALRRGVWTYVGVERHAGTSPGHVIMVLNDLIDAAKVAPVSVHAALTRRVILWCVEAYFGHLGGDVAGRAGLALSGAADAAAAR